jgi:hypothetical protein
MTEQTRAERLADELDAGGNFYAESSTWYDRKLSGAVGEDAAELRLLERQVEVLRAERDHARAKCERAVRLLTGIHALLYPAPIKTPDGRTLVFRPKDPDPHEVLQELSDRIRALPDEIARAAIAKATGEPA